MPAVMVIILAVSAGHSALPGQDRMVNPELSALVPELESWTEEERLSFFPDNLFEYINGAAESYLSYDFQELLVVRFIRQARDAAANLSLEIYDMGSGLNAFGIFSAERYPGNPPVEIGDAAYQEGEALNFMAGRYYVKILAFGAGEDTAAVARQLAEKTASAVKEKTGLPAMLSVFPSENMILQSERYIKDNFMGHSFLHDGFTALYKVGDQEALAFLVDASSEKEAEEMLESLLDFHLQEKLIPAKIASGYHIKDRYDQHLFFTRIGKVICGVSRIPDGMEKEGERLIKALSDALSERMAGKAGKASRV